MFSKHSITTLILLLGLEMQTVWLTNLSCRKCMTNGAYCLDGKRYYRCKGEGILPDMSITYECAENEVCSMEGRICVDRSEVVEANIACPESLGCDKCPEIYEWPPTLTCVSATEYRVCQPAGVATKVACPTDSMCSEEGYQHTGLICLNSKVIEELNFKITCPNSDSISPASQNLLNSCEEFNATKNIECFNIQNLYDAQCKSFIKCQRVGGVFVGTLENCTEDLYYDQTINECVKDKPNGCSSIVPSF